MSDDDNVYWIFEMTVKDGKLDELEGLMNEMVAKVESDEPDTLNYEWSLSEDQKTVHVLECYASSDAVMKHLAGFGAVADRFMGCVTPTRLTVYGTPNDQVRSAIAAFGPTYIGRWGGFSR